MCHGVFTRHPNLRVATIESGSDWVPLLLRALKKSFGQVPVAYDGVDPVQQVRDHVWVSPYYEDDLAQLRDELGANRMIFGSDYPHAEGLADPLTFVDDLPGFTDDEIRLVMRENALALSQPPHRDPYSALLPYGCHSGLLGGEALAHGVLADRARLDELEQVVGAAGLRADARQAEAAERLASDDGAGGAAVQVDVARRGVRWPRARGATACARSSPPSARSRCRWRS